MITARIIAATFLAVTGVVCAQEPPTPPAESQPDLDELLGLKKPGQPAPATPDTTKTELDRHLKAEEVSDEFAQAVGLMDESAQRLTAAQDTGLDTQRLQSDALKRLDKLIDEAQKKGGKKQQQRQKSKPQQQQDQSQAQKQSSQQTDKPQPTNQEGTPQVARQDGALTPPRASESASWGSLPEHIRQALTEGRSDRFSSLYQQMTEQYYKRLAEQPRSGAPR